jgi:plastocyanin
VKRRLLACAAAVALTSLSACSSGGDNPGIAVVMSNFRFRPVDLQISPGEQVTFKNVSQTLHNFTLINGGQVAFDVPAGESVSTDKLGALRTGTYRFKCRYHLSQGMIGVLVVTSTGT